RELKPTEPFWKTSEPLRLSNPPLPPQETESDPRPRSNQTEARTLIVGAGMSLSGTITSCDRLVAEGTVDAKLDGCQQVIVAQTGRNLMPRSIGTGGAAPALVTASSTTLATARNPIVED